jgi:hypothetical protein
MTNDILRPLRINITRPTDAQSKRRQAISHNASLVPLIKRAPLRNPEDHELYLSGPWLAIGRGAITGTAVSPRLTT